MRKLHAPYTQRTGRGLSRLLWKLFNRRRPIAGHVVHVLRGSPIKGSGDFNATR